MYHRHFYPATHLPWRNFSSVSTIIYANVVEPYLHKFPSTTISCSTYWLEDFCKGKQRSHLHMQTNHLWYLVLRELFLPAGEGSNVLNLSVHQSHPDSEKIAHQGDISYPNLVSMSYTDSGGFCYMDWGNPSHGLRKYNSRNSAPCDSFIVVSNFLA